MLTSNPTPSLPPLIPPFSSSSFSSTSSSNYTKWPTRWNRLPMPGPRVQIYGAFYHAKRMEQWREMAPEIVSPAVSPAPRRLPRRLRPVVSEPTLRPPPPSPELESRRGTELQLFVRQMEQAERAQRCRQEETPAMTFKSFVKSRRRRTTAKKKPSLPPLPSRDVPILRRSQGVAAIGCPCCRRQRDLQGSSGIGSSRNTL